MLAHWGDIESQAVHHQRKTPNSGQVHLRKQIGGVIIKLWTQEEEEEEVFKTKNIPHVKSCNLKWLVILLYVFVSFQ